MTTTIQQDIDALPKEPVMRIRKPGGVRISHREWHAHCHQQVVRRNAEIALLVRALQEYAHHHSQCRVIVYSIDSPQQAKGCNCGLDAVLKAVQR